MLVNPAMPQIAKALGVPVGELLE